MYLLISIIWCLLVFAMNAIIMSREWIGHSIEDGGG